MNRPFVAAAAAFATLATFATGTAAAARDVAVRYGDLDLSTAAGRDRLDARIVRAARTVCDDRSGPRSVQENVAVSSCVRAARDSARTRMAANGGATLSGG